MKTGLKKEKKQSVKKCGNLQIAPIMFSQWVFIPLIIAKNNNKRDKDQKTKRQKKFEENNLNGS